MSPSWRGPSIVGSIVIFVLSNLYWWRRERTVRKGMAVARDWDDNSDRSGREIDAATEAAGTSLEDLAEEIERLHDRIEAQDAEIAEYSTQLGNVRARWAELWWDGLTAEQLTVEEPSVLTLVIPDGETADARALAKRAANERLVGIVGAGGEGTFVVTVGEELTEHVSAAALAGEVAADVGGGAGGSKRSATGGGAVGGLRSAIEDVEQRLEDRPPFG
jgi:alanyl-tRNA synthetase